MYRLCEPPKLYSRRDDPQEPHNLAEVPRLPRWGRGWRRMCLRVMVEGSHFVPSPKDPRFPKINLESPKSQ